MKKKTGFKILSLLVMLCTLIMANAVVVQAEGETEVKGSVEITIAPFAENTAMAIAEVGGLNNGRYEVNEAFADTGVVITGLTEASQAQEAANKLAAAAAEKQVAVVSKTDADGKVKFSDLKVENTLYVIYQIDNTEVVKVSPMLVTMPYVNLEGEALTDVKLNAKYEDVRIIPEKGAVILNKTDLKKNKLAGAEFRFEEKIYLDGSVPESESESFEQDEKGTYFWQLVVETLVTDKNGQIAVDNLPLGTYRFIETKAPDGYVLDSTPQEFEIKTAGTLKQENGIYVADEGEVVVLNFENKPVEESVPPPPPESSEPEIPSQPSEGTVTGDSIGKYIVIGVVVGVSLVAVVLLVVLGKKKKNSDEE